MIPEVVFVAGILGFAILIVVADDWWKRRLPEVETTRHRLGDLNRRLGFFAKLWMTLVLLVFGALVAPLLVLGVHQLADPLLHELLVYTLEAVAIFYVALVAYIWWRPKWMVRIYNLAESKLVRTAYVVCGIIVVGAVLVVVQALIRSLM